MKKRTVVALITTLILSTNLSACSKSDSFPPETETSNNSDSIRIEELEQRIEELESENKELKAQLDNSDSTDSNQQSTNEAETLLQATIQSPETSGVCGADLTWYYQNGILAITGTGEMTDYGNGGKDTPWYDLKDKIGWIIIDDGVTTIGEYAFSTFPTLSKIELSNTLTIVGARAFENCYNLKQVTIPASITYIDNAFAQCININEIVFKGNKPDGYMIWGIGEGASAPARASDYEPTEEEMLRAKGEYLHPMVIYYTGDTFDEFINSYPYWDDYGVEWIKQ